MLFASAKRSPWAWVLETDSDPAKSTLKSENTMNVDNSIDIMSCKTQQFAKTVVYFYKWDKKFEINAFWDWIHYLNKYYPNY